ncbi:MAG: hypothetical protein JSS32_06605 [Verrucomicrobia bacterium]|nr:hypothetical protein [Verrucomicrobiota bacterium]
MRSLHPWPIFPTNLEPHAARALSLQFLMQELICTLESLEENHLEIEAISGALEKFLLFSLENPLSQKGGSLDKLCFYSEILLKNSLVDEDEGIPILLEDLRVKTLSMRSKISLYRKSGHRSQNKEAILHEWDKFVQEARDGMRNIFDSLFLFFKESREDENFLFLLIELRERINRHLGPKTTETVLARLFPQGICTLRAALYNGYARRGFLDFYTRNEQLIDALEWEDSCSLNALKR